MRGNRGISGRLASVGNVGVENRGTVNDGRRGSSGRTKYLPGEDGILEGLPGVIGTASWEGEDGTPNGLSNRKVSSTPIPASRSTASPVKS